MDLEAQALSRIAWQYRGAAKFRQWVGILPRLAQQELEDPLQRVADTLDLDNASGAMLDVAGAIVGQPRTYRDSIDRNSRRWGAQGLQFGAANTYFAATSETIDQDAEDALYRLLIKAKVGTNTGDATINGIVKAIKFFVATDSVNVNDYEDMSFDVVFGEALKPEERFVFRNFPVVPRPQGVKLLGFAEPAVRTAWGSTRFGVEGEGFGASYYELNY